MICWWGECDCECLPTCPECSPPLTRRQLGQSITSPSSPPNLLQPQEGIKRQMIDWWTAIIGPPPGGGVSVQQSRIANSQSKLASEPAPVLGTGAVSPSCSCQDQLSLQGKDAKLWIKLYLWPHHWQDRPPRGLTVQQRINKKNYFNLKKVLKLI